MVSIAAVNSFATSRFDQLFSGAGLLRASSQYIDLFEDR